MARGVTPAKVEEALAGHPRVAGARQGGADS